MASALEEVVAAIDARIIKLEKLKRDLMLEMAEQNIDLLEKMLRLPGQSVDRPSGSGVDRQHQLRQHLQQHGPQRLVDITKKLKMGHSTVYYLLRKNPTLFKKLPDQRIAVDGG